MSMIKQYLAWVEEHQEVFQQLPLREEWREIKDFSNYEVSNFARVYNKEYNRYLTPQKIHLHYWGVYLRSGEGRRNCHALHTLVGRHFLPDYEEGMDICHHDETLPFPEINYPYNLWSGTRSDNMRDAVKKRRHNTTKLTEELVIRIRYGYETPETLSKNLSVSKATIRDIRKGRTWQWV
jgi:hypothetical protein